MLTLKAQSQLQQTTVFYYFFFIFPRQQVLTFHVNRLFGRLFFYFSEKTSLDISGEVSAWRSGRC